MKNLMKKFGYYNYIIVILLIVSSLLLLWRYKSDIVNYNYKINNLKFQYKQLSEEEELLKKFFINQQNILSRYIIDTILKTEDIADSFNGNFIIAFFSKQSCGTCNKRLIIDLTDFKQKQNFDKIYLCGDITENEFYTKMDIKVEDFKYYYIPQFFSGIEEYSKYASLFVLNSDELVKSIFVPELLKNFNEIYFSDVLPDLIYN
jgi:hypothetical protein